tara:strand:+ start:256 stop:654 length:399 start_codon:yes stop_codon:yes gene_type:complete
MPKRLTTPKRKMPKRARMTKGSKEAMEWGRRMRELKEKKAKEKRKKSPRKKSPRKKSPRKKSRKKNIVKKVDEIVIFAGDVDTVSDVKDGTRYTVRRTMMNPSSIESPPNSYGTIGPIPLKKKLKKKSTKKR